MPTASKLHYSNLRLSWITLHSIPFLTIKLSPCGPVNHPPSLPAPWFPGGAQSRASRSRLFTTGEMRGERWSLVLTCTMHSPQPKVAIAPRVTTHQRSRTVRATDRLEGLELREAVEMRPSACLLHPNTTRQLRGTVLEPIFLHTAPCHQTTV